jgi:hypothetical protein
MEEYQLEKIEGACKICQHLHNLFGRKRCVMLSCKCDGKDLHKEDK